jgi:hypothetical protein
MFDALFEIGRTLIARSSDEMQRAAAKVAEESGSATFVAVMQAIDLREGDDSSGPERHDRVRVRTILIEGKMRAAAVVVVGIR